jgi:Zn-finger nucleic acid-binding protein
VICPICKVELKMAERQGVEIDYCPQCRGVWLDRGELDKIIERSTGAGPADDLRRHESDGDRSRNESDGDRSRHESDGDRGAHDSHGGYGDKKRKKKSLLGDIFDF